MKLSCPHGQSQRDCLSFKVGGNTTVTQRKAKLIKQYDNLNVSIPAKFNCTVPGTLLDHSTDCPPEPTTLTVPQVSTDIIKNPTRVTTATATNLTALNERHPSKFKVGSRLFYAVVGAGGGMVMLLVCCLCCVCAVLVYRRHATKGEHNKIPVILYT